MLHKAPIIFVLILLFNLDSNSQHGFYVPRQAKIYFAGDTATIFSNVLNHGTFGVDKKATINFKGQQWQNDPLAKITDETLNGSGVAGQGGVVRFMADTGRQKLLGGYNVAALSGPVFAQLHLLNPSGLELVESSAKVWQEMRFVKGRFYLNNQLFVVGHRQPGRITGYDSARYFVTGTQLGSGLLVRENITAASGLVTFPVGTTDFAYTPAALETRSARGDDFYVGVFDGVRNNVTTGASLSNLGVNSTWQIGKRFFPGQDEVKVYLQHLDKNEGDYFAANKNRSYIAQYTTNKWDTGIVGTTVTPGYLTSGAALANSTVNHRALSAKIAGTSYFTKFVAQADSTVTTNLLLGAYRAGAFFVQVHWQTRPEINIKRFIVERKRANESNFVRIDSLSSLAANGISKNYLNYSIRDSNSYNGISFYRLKLISYSDSSYYSPIVGVRGVSFSQIGLWPNPAKDHFSIILDGRLSKAVMIYNGLGQLLWKEDVQDRNVIEFKNLSLTPGMYYVTIIGKDNSVIRTEKLLIANH